MPSKKKKLYTHYTHTIKEPIKELKFKKNVSLTLKMSTKTKLLMTFQDILLQAGQYSNRL